MKVKEVILNVMRLVSNDKTADDYADGRTLDDEEKKSVNQLLRAYNLVLKEIATDYLPLEMKETFSGGNVEFSSFSKNPLKIISVLKNGENVEYEIRPASIKIPNGENFEITYSYMPDEQTPADDFPYYGKIVEERAFCYGIASEFCLINGRYDEASNWDSKYRRAIDTAFKHSAKKIKGRLWL